MLNIAQREGWIKQNPFATGESIISLADERKREADTYQRRRAATPESLLYYFARTLAPILIAALDTGMRRGELFSLRWQHVDFVEGVLNIEAFHTKTMKARQISLTARLTSELQTLYEQSPKDPFRRVFGILTNVKRSFDAARKDARLMDVRFHDLRHTAATRLVGGTYAAFRSRTHPGPFSAQHDLSLCQHKHRHCKARGRDL